MPFSQRPLPPLRPRYPNRPACAKPRSVALFTLFPLLALAAAQAAAPAPPGPEHFFVGRTEGQGNVHVIIAGTHAVRHRGHGRMARDGALLIDQVVEEEGKPARRRSWRLVRSGPNRFTGTITDARGPVTGTLAGNVLHLRYRSAEGPSVEQWITLRPGGRSAHNRMTFRRFGIVVARVDEVIRRLD